MTSFNEANLVKKLEQVTTTQDSIQTLSLWVLHHKNHCKTIVEQWLTCYRKSKSTHQLALFYLANDIVQHSRRKSLSFLEEFKAALRQAAKMTHDSKTITAIKRVLDIWTERAIYGKEFIDELRALFERDEGHNLALINKIVSDYSLKDVVGQIENLSKVEKQTQAKVESSRNCPIDCLNKDLLKEKLKDKSNGEQFNQAFEEAAKQIRLSIEAFDKEISARRELLGVLEKTKIYHGIQFKEAKTVVATFRDCELGVNQVKAKLDATFPNISSSKKSSSSTIADSIPTSTLRSVMNTIQQAQNNASSSSHNSTSSLDQRLSMMSTSGTFGGLSLLGGSSDENNSPFHTVYDPKFQPYYNPSMDFSNLYGGGTSNNESNRNNNNSSTENTENGPADMDLANSDDEDSKATGGNNHDKQQQQSNNKGGSAIETGPLAGGSSGGFNLMGLLGNPMPFHNLPPPPPPPPLPPSLKDFFPNGAPPPFPGAPSQLPPSHIPLPPLPPGLMMDQMIQQQQQQHSGGNTIRSLADSRQSARNHSAPYTLHPPPPPPPNNAQSSNNTNWRNNPSNNNNHNNRNHHHQSNNNGNNQGPNNHRGWKGGGSGGQNNSNNNGNNNRGSWKQRNSYGNHH